MSDAEPALGNWEQLNKCPDCGADMERLAQVGEQVGLYYRCRDHGRFRYSWDDDRLERVPQGERSATPPNSQGPNSQGPNSQGPNSQGPNCQGPNSQGPNSQGLNSATPKSQDD